jgi:hypothetical protein
MVVAYFLNRWSWELDEEYTHRRARRLRLLSGPGLVLYGVTITLASVDWIMSLQSGWYSSIFGVLIAVSQIVPAFAFAMLVLLYLAPQPPLAGFLDETTWRDLGNLLLAFLMIWAYIAFSQFFLMWCGNLPEEIVWYLRRGQRGWEWVGAAIALFFFAVPFFALFNAEVKTDPRKLLWVLGIILIMSYVNYYWMIIPSLGFYPEPSFAGPDAHVPTPPLGMSWLDPFTFVGLGGLWIAWYCWCLAARPLLPVHDPVLQEVPQHG